MLDFEKELNDHGYQITETIGGVVQKKAVYVVEKDQNSFIAKYYTQYVTGANSWDEAKKIHLELDELKIGPRVYDTIEITPILGFIIMEMGESIRRKEAKNNQVIEQLIDHMHNHGYLHGDLHCGNIVKMNDNRYVFIDFETTSNIHNSRQEVLQEILDTYQVSDYQEAVDYEKTHYFE